MTVRIEMPLLSSEGESATLASWLVKVGDPVEEGDVIAELETDKSTVELEAPATGVIAEIMIVAGTEDLVPGTLLASIDSESDSDADPPAASVAAEKPAAEDAPVESVESAAAPAPDVMTGPAPEVASEASASPRSSTPLARRAAAHRGLDLENLEGSGPGGRILEADVLQSSETSAPTSSPPVASKSSDAGSSSGTAAPALPAESAIDAGERGGFETVRLSAMRKTIARRMSEAKQEIPHFYLRTRCRLDGVLEVRSRLNAELAAAGRESKISVNDFVVRAVALALRDVPRANVRYAGDAIHVFDRVDIAVAVATDGGLVTPIVRDADRKGLAVIGDEMKELASRARSGALRPDEYQDATMTVSNLGMYGVETVYPILNPPQACILGVGAAEETPVVRDGAVEVGHVASITLAADHRVVDGAVGAELLAAVRSRLEDPLAMVL